MSFYAVAVGRKIGIYNNWYVEQKSHLKSMKSFPFVNVNYFQNVYIYCTTSLMPH